MTKLPQTISKRINVITGEEVPLGCVDQHYPRASGRTAGYALQLLGIAQADGASFGIDHHDYSEKSAYLLKSEVDKLINKLGFSGLRSRVMSTTQIRGLRYAPLRQGYHSSNCVMWGVFVEFNIYQEVHYDLRK